MSSTASGFQLQYQKKKEKKNNRHQYKGCVGTSANLEQNIIYACLDYPNGTILISYSGVGKIWQDNNTKGDPYGWF